jgi:hypothetical protein
MSVVGAAPSTLSKLQPRDRQGDRRVAAQAEAEDGVPNRVVAFVRTTPVIKSAVTSTRRLRVTGACFVAARTALPTTTDWPLGVGVPGRDVGAHPVDRRGELLGCLGQRGRRWQQLREREDSEDLRVGEPRLRLEDLVPDVTEVARHRTDGAGDAGDLERRGGQSRRPLAEVDARSGQVHEDLTGVAGAGLGPDREPLLQVSLGVGHGPDGACRHAFEHRDGADELADGGPELRVVVRSGQARPGTLSRCAGTTRDGREGAPCRELRSGR